MFEPLPYFIGELFILMIMILAIVFIIVIVLGNILLKKGILIFPKFQLFLLDIFYSPIKTISKLLKQDDYFIDKISIETRNRINRKKFDSIPPEKKLIFLPHCLRHRECKADLGEQGLTCTQCGKCSIGVIKNKAEPLGYRIYIVPGGSFVKKILKENKFKSVLGIACYEDLSQTMTLLSDFYPVGVLLKKTGCFETKVDVKEVLDKL